MNKQEFLLQLKASIASLSNAEQDDILRDMEEYFYEASQRNQSEQESVRKLGSVKILAETLTAETKVKRIKQADTIAQKISALFGALTAVMLLTPFNLIFVLLPLLLVMFMIVIGFPIVLVIACSLPVVLIIIFILMFQAGFKFFALLGLLFFALGWTGMVTAIVTGFFGFHLGFFQSDYQIMPMEY